MTTTEALELTTTTTTMQAETSPALLGPEAWTLLAGEVDPRPNEAWRFVWRMGDGLAS